MAARTFLTVVEKLGSSSTFLLCGLLAIASLIFSFFRVREVNGRTLEQIEESACTKLAPAQPERYFVHDLIAQ